MKANELMVGDYLMHNGFPYRVIQVDGIVRDGWMIENGEEDCGEPIPITPELLEKNGFTKDDNDNMYYWNWGIIDDCVSYDKETNIFRIFHTLGRLVFVHPLSYVHQLQHALRLCGINKTIEL